MRGDHAQHDPHLVQVEEMEQSVPIGTHASLWASVSAYVPGHNLSHHMHTQSNRDVMRTTKAQFKWNFLNQLFFLFIVGPSIAKADKDYVLAMKDERPYWYKQWKLEFLVMAVVTVGLFIIDWQKAGHSSFRTSLLLGALWALTTRNMMAAIKSIPTTTPQLYGLSC